MNRIDEKQDLTERELCEVCGGMAIEWKSDGATYNTSTGNWDGGNAQGAAERAAAGGG